MKDIARKLRLLLSVLLLGDVAAVWANEIVLTSANSYVQVAPDYGMGVHAWNVDGFEHLNKSWFWYRIGSAGGETSLEQLNLQPIIHPDDSLATIRYTAADIEFAVDLVLLGGSEGSGFSRFSQGLTLTNPGTESLDLHFFQYFDLDVDESFTANTVTITGGTTAVQSGPQGSIVTTHAQPAASRYQVALYPDLLNQLTSGTPTTLNNYGGPVSGDLAYAFQWDLTIPAGGSVRIDVTSTIPEPGAAWLVALAALPALLRRRVR